MIEGFSQLLVPTDPGITEPWETDPNYGMIAMRAQEEAAAIEKAAKLKEKKKTKR